MLVVLVLWLPSAFSFAVTLSVYSACSSAVASSLFLRSLSLVSAPPYLGHIILHMFYKLCRDVWASTKASTPAFTLWVSCWCGAPISRGLMVPSLPLLFFLGAPGGVGFLLPLVPVSFYSPCSCWPRLRCSCFFLQSLASPPVLGLPKASRPVCHVRTWHSLFRFSSVLFLQLFRGSW